MSPPSSRVFWMDSPEELRLARAARRGSAAAYRTLIRHYQAPLYRLAHALSRGPLGALRLLEDAVARGAGAVRQWPGDERAFHWLTHIVGHLALEQGRVHRGRGGAALPALGETTRSLDPASLRVRLGKLDMDEQVALALRIVEGLNCADIDRVLKTRPGMTWSRIAEARLRLAELPPRGQWDAHRAHVPSLQISASLDGAFEGMSRELVERHLVECEQCRAEHDELIHTNRALAAVLRPRESPELEEALASVLDLVIRRGVEVARRSPHHRRAEALLAALPATPDAGPGTTSPSARVPEANPVLRPEQTPPGEVRSAERASRHPASPVAAMILLGATLGFTLWMAQRRAGLESGGPPPGGRGPVSVPAAMPDSAIVPLGPAKEQDLPPSKAAPPRSIQRREVSSDPPDAVARAIAAKESLAVAPSREAVRREVVAGRSAAKRRPPAAIAGGMLCGEVRDDADRAVVGAHVMLADLEVAVLTDRHGRFCIAAPGGERTLTVMALGFESARQLVSVADRTSEVTIRLRAMTLSPVPSPR